MVNLIPEQEICPWSYSDDRALLEKVIKDAARLSLDYFRRNDLSVWNKSPNNPVSEADLAVDQFLKSVLCGSRPGYGWLSEESSDTPERLKCGRLWIVDPIDGTRAFLKGTDDWGISIALIEGKTPVLGAFYAPARQEFYMAEKHNGAELNGKPIHVSSIAVLKKARMMGDPSGFVNRHWPIPWPPQMAYEKANSIALRLCLVAKGSADCCVTLRPKNDWDVAAADLILKEAGGCLETGSGDIFVYNKPEPIQREIIASNGLLKSEIRQRLEAVIKL